MERGHADVPSVTPAVWTVYEADLGWGKYFILKLTENAVLFHGIKHTFEISYPK